MAAVRPAPGSLVAPTLQLSILANGIAFGGPLLRLPNLAGVGGVAAACAYPELREAPTCRPLRASSWSSGCLGYQSWVASGRLAPLVVVDPVTPRVLGGGTLHRLDAEWAVVWIAGADGEDGAFESMIRDSGASLRIG